MVGDAEIEGNAHVIFIIGDVGDAADVEADLIVAEKQFVANRNKRCALSALADIFATEVVDDGETTGLGQLLSVADLQGVMLLWTVKDGVAVRGDEVRRDIVFLGKSQHLFA